MKEKMYYEVLEEMERKKSSQYEILLELGEICFFYDRKNEPRSSANR